MCAVKTLCIFAQHNETLACKSIYKKREKKTFQIKSNKCCSAFPVSADIERETWTRLSFSFFMFILTISANKLQFVVIILVYCLFYRKLYRFLPLKAHFPFISVFYRCLLLLLHRIASHWITSQSVAQLNAYSCPTQTHSCILKQ